MGFMAHLPLQQHGLLGGQRRGLGGRGSTILLLRLDARAPHAAVAAAPKHAQLVGLKRAQRGLRLRLGARRVRQLAVGDLPTPKGFSRAYCVQADTTSLQAQCRPREVRSNGYGTALP